MFLDHRTSEILEGRAGATVDLTILGESLVCSLALQNEVIYNTYVLPSNPRSANIESESGQAAAPAEIVIVNLDDAALNPVRLPWTNPLIFSPGDGTAEMFIDDIAIAKDPNSIGEQAS